MSTKKASSQKDSFNGHAFVARVATNALFEEYLSQWRSEYEDIWHLNKDRFLVEDGRLIAEKIKTAPQKEGRLILLYCVQASPDIQNTLLKSLEEPPEGVKVIWCMPDLNILLPTIVSRVQVLLIPPPKNLDSHKIHTSFEKNTQNARSPKILSTQNNKDMSKEDFLLWLDQKIATLHNKQDHKAPDYKALKTALMCRKYALDHASNIKMLAERVLAL